MKTVNEIQLQEEKYLIKYAINELRKNDYNLIDLLDESQVVEDDINKQQLERKLHEVCINHRLACYLENGIKKKKLPYYVDIEYNRYYTNQKHVSINGESRQVRPDILIHTRINKIDGIPQHYIVIEAKKDKISTDDEKKVKAFMMDQNYEYLFGITIKYGNLNPAHCKIYYSLNGQDISCEVLLLPYNVQQ